MKAKTSRQNKGLFTSRTITIITLVSTSVRAAVMKNIHKKKHSESDSNDVVLWCCYHYSFGYILIELEQLLKRYSYP